MCGFTGYLNYISSESSSAMILEMLKIQNHRGPDDSGVLGINMETNDLHELTMECVTAFNNKPNLIFGFNRLSILDLSPAGHQPMIHKDSKVALMMNGEVYNAFDFRDELRAKGFTFKGNSDTEVVLYLYLAFGLHGMLERLNGMFALAIYDGKEKKLYLIRDRVGIKPLYVLKEKSRLAFSSEMKSFKALSDFKFELDETKLSEFLLFRNCINATLFRNIVNITPGTYLKIDASGALEEHVYYDLRKEGQGEVVQEKAILERTLQRAVKRQMISDVKLGCQLSGGVDSSLVTAFAAERLPKNALETFSIIFKEKHFSEKRYIDQAAQKFCLISHQFILDASAYINMIDDAIWHFEQPLNHPNTIGIKLLSKEAKKHVTVLLSGEGADETLAGYSRFLDGSGSFFSKSNIKIALKNLSQLSSFLKFYSNSEIRYILKTAYGGFSTAKSLYKNFSEEAALDSRIKIWKSINDPKSLRKKRKYELLTFLPDLLMRQDKMSMAHAIENRVPFLDNEMISTAISYDDALLIQTRNGQKEGKFPLKQLCASVFDEDFAFREKMGFGIPLRQFFTSEPFQKRWTTELLPSIKARGLFRTKFLEKWMRNPEKLTAEQIDALWLMMGFEIWAKQYLD
jgi:asparagine synthase (glutamine-hydrolysing)